jgi:hypothetical protein
MSCSTSIADMFKDLIPDIYERGFQKALLNIKYHLSDPLSSFVSEHEQTRNKGNVQNTRVLLALDEFGDCSDWATKLMFCCNSENEKNWQIDHYVKKETFNSPEKLKIIEDTEQITAKQYTKICDTLANKRLLDSRVNMEDTKSLQDDHPTELPSYVELRNTLSSKSEHILSTPFFTKHM